MLVIRSHKGWPLKLERKLSDVEGWGLWEFHRSASTVSPDHGHTAYRLARIRPAEPKEGQNVEVALLHSPGAPEEQWLLRGTGVASYDSDR